MADTRNLSADTPGAKGPGNASAVPFALAIILSMAVAGFLCGYGTGAVSGGPSWIAAESDPGHRMRGVVAALFSLLALTGAFGTGWVWGRMTGRHGVAEDGGEVPAGGEANASGLSGPAAPWGRAGSGVPAVALGGSGLSLPPRH